MKNDEKSQHALDIGFTLGTLMWMKNYDRLSPEDVERIDDALKAMHRIRIRAGILYEDDVV